MFCAGRVTVEDMKRTQKACGGAIASSTRDLRPECLGSAENFEECQVGADRFNIFTGNFKFINNHVTILEEIIEFT